VTEFPYQVSPERVHEQIRDSRSPRSSRAISDVRTNPDKEGIRLVIELKRDVHPDGRGSNQLYKHTQCSRRSRHHAGAGGRTPKELTLSSCAAFHRARHTVITLRTEFELAARAGREHILEGLKIAGRQHRRGDQASSRNRRTRERRRGAAQAVQAVGEQSGRNPQHAPGAAHGLEITKLDEE